MSTEGGFDAVVRALDDVSLRKVAAELFLDGMGRTAAEWRAKAAQNYPSPGFETEWTGTWYWYSDLIAAAEAYERAEAEKQRLVDSQRGLIGDDGAA